MAQTANEILADNAVAHQVGVIGYSESQIKQISNLLQEASIDLERQIYNASTAISKERLTRLLGAVDRFSQKLQKDMYGFSSRGLKDLGQLQASIALHDLQAVFPKGLGISLSTPNFGLISSAALARPMRGKLLKDWWKDWGEGTRQAVSQQIKLGMVENESIDQIVRRIRGTSAKAGLITGLKFRHAAAITRTAVSHVANHAHQAVWEANDDIIEKVQWLSTLDADTTPICQARDGETYPVHSGPRPPAHIGCRSTTVPILKPWNQMGLKDPGPRFKASMNGVVPGDMNYQDWLTRMSKSRPGLVRRILGTKRAALFMKGKLTVKNFVNMKSGKPWDLPYLKTQHPKAWKKAFPKLGNEKPIGKPPGKILGAIKPVVKNPKAEMQAFLVKQKALQAKQKQQILPEVFDTGSTGVTMARIEQLLDKIPGATVALPKFKKFLAKYQPGSVMGLPSHLTKAGLRKRQARLDLYMKAKPAAAVYDSYWAERYSEIGSSSDAWGWTNRIFNAIAVKVSKTQAGLKNIKMGGFKNFVTWAAENAAPNGNKYFSFSGIARSHPGIFGDDAMPFITWIHEMGHQVHYRAGFPRMYAYKKAAITEYGTYNSREFAAEHFAAYILDREALLAFNPKIVQFIEEMIEKAMQSP